MATFWDTHVHLSLCEGISVEEHIAEARRHGLVGFLDAGLSPSDFAKRFDLLEGEGNAFVGIGYAPSEATEFPMEEIALLEEELQAGRPDALCEVGLEFHHFKDNWPIQAEVLEHQLHLAKRYDLPVFLHIRDATNEVLALLRQSGVGRGAVHCFTGTKNDAKRFVDLGFLISFSGILTFNRSDDLRSIAAALPLDALLTETDAPYLSPVPLRGKPNRMWHLRHTNRVLAGLRGVSEEAFAKTLEANFLRLMGKGRGRSPQKDNRTPP